MNSAETATKSADIEIQYRIGAPADALCVGVLATQVFLDTYAIEGIRPDLAREVLTICSTDALAARLSDEDRTFLLAERGGNLVGFAEIRIQRPCSIEGDPGQVEVVTLYVQSAFHRQGIGSGLMRQAESIAANAGASSIWLTAWAENHQALAFYQTHGYEDVGRIDYVFEDQVYDNRVLMKTIAR